MPNAVMGEVFITKTNDRNAGIRTLLSRFELGGFSGKRVALKANFNSADPFPASTHIETLSTLIKILKEAKEETGFGQRRLRAYLEKRYHITLSERTIWKILKKQEMAEEVAEERNKDAA